jgi:hypothetical protein
MTEGTSVMAQQSGSNPYRGHIIEKRTGGLSAAGP